MWWAGRGGAEGPAGGRAAGSATGNLREWGAQPGEQRLEAAALRSAEAQGPREPAEAGPHLLPSPQPCPRHPFLQWGRPAREKKVQCDLRASAPHSRDL